MNFFFSFWKASIVHLLLSFFLLLFSISAFFWKYIGNICVCFSSDSSIMVCSKKRTTFCCYVSSSWNCDRKFDWCRLLRRWFLSGKVMLMLLRITRFVYLVCHNTHYYISNFKPFNNICSLLGSVVVVIGFYTVMWGKANEKKIVAENTGEITKLDNETAPLLQDVEEQITSPSS